MPVKTDPLVECLRGGESELPVLLPLDCKRQPEIVATVSSKKRLCHCPVVVLSHMFGALYFCVPVYVHGANISSFVFISFYTAEQRR